MSVGARSEGTCDAAFAAVRAAYDDVLAGDGGAGSAFALSVDGRIVVDLWGGAADAAGSRRWRRDTVVNVFSVGKAWTALALHLLVEDGRVDLGDAVARHWPEFAGAGKENVTVTQLLAHTSGVAAIRAPLPPGSLYDWDAMVRALESQEPWWEPGTAHGYHAVTFGWLVGEVVRRVGGRSVGSFLRERVAEPFELAIHLGFGPDAGLDVAEVRPTVVPPEAADNPLATAMTDPESLTAKAFANPVDLFEPGAANTDRWRAAEIPAVNAHARARALADLYGNLAGGRPDRPILAPAVAGVATTEAVRGPDRVLGLETAFALGFMRPSVLRPFGRAPGVFGHPGAGGALGFGDPTHRLGFGFTPSLPIAAMAGGDPRWPGLLDAVYGSL